MNPSPVNIAILDDCQSVAPFDAICVMRERTSMSAKLLQFLFLH